MKRLEDQLQRAVVTLLALHERMGRLRFFSVPNGGWRSKSEARILKGLGVRAGVPDLVVLIPPREHITIRAPANPCKTIFLELKSAKGKLSPAQKEWSEWLLSSDFLWAEVRSLDDVEKILKYHLGGKCDERAKTPAVRAVIQGGAVVSPAYQSPVGKAVLPNDAQS